MQSEGIPFELRDVGSSSLYREEFLKTGAQGVPTFVIGDDVIIGFNKDEILRKIDFFIDKCYSCKKKMMLPKNKGKIKATCPSCGEKTIFNTDK